MSACLNQFGLPDINCTVMVNDNIAEIYNDLIHTLVTKIGQTNIEYNPWIFAAIGSGLIGLSGIFPLLIISMDDDNDNVKNGAGAHKLKVLLSFAVGGLLGDVFLHLLPEAWANDVKHSPAKGHPCLFSGFMLLSGMLLFICIEKLFSGMTGEVTAENDENLLPSKQESYLEQNNNNKNIIKEETNLLKKENSGFVKNGFHKSTTRNGCVNNGSLVRQPSSSYKKSSKIPKIIKKSSQTKHISGYLNLMANSIDNFTHGLAVGGSFLISLRLGVFTTVAILIHEIPHEIGDFAILLKSGFSKWDAAKAQLLTASGGLIGSLVAVASSGGGDAVENQTSWILPFTAGGFLHIALVTVLPDLLKEDNYKESMKQFMALLFGILVMAGMTMIE